MSECEWADTRVMMSGWYCLTHNCSARTGSQQCPLAEANGDIHGAWRGLHNPEWHRPTVGPAEARCGECLEDCSEDYPCNCCLAAEVKRLAAENESLRERIEAARSVCYQERINADYQHSLALGRFSRRVIATLDGDA